jgi:amino acid adenylation domain-containing protein
MSTSRQGKLESLIDEGAQRFGRSEMRPAEAKSAGNDGRATSPHSMQQAIRAKYLQTARAFVEFPKDDVEHSIPERFESIVRKHPHTVAVKAEHQVVTYAELNVLANRLAHTIVRQRGTEAEPIGVLLEKGLEQIVAILGILKAGKFFALLDPSFPQARNTVILANLQPGIVITNQQNVSSTETFKKNPHHFLEIESCHAETGVTDLALRIPSTENAVILYTSGSTGEPKGVIQSHRNVLHNIMLRTNAFGIGADDKLSVLASGTPNALMNAFLGLLNGATLALFDVQKEGTTHLASWLSREKISFCWSTAPLFRKLCEMLHGKEEFPDLRHVVLASDRASKTDLDLFKKHFSVNTTLSNALTGSETGLLRTFMIDHHTEIPGNDLPVGYVVEDKDVFLLDDEGKQLGFNEVGEIVVNSEYISPGYWRRPDLTEAKFKSAPSGSGARFYFTGDSGLMLSDGCLVYKGRKDFRIKIRGYGVEIAEVEKALREHPMIKETVVVAHRNESGEARLVAYFVGSPQGNPTVSELREFLGEKLPDYMIPSIFVKLDAMPLSSGGKVDRAALPDPDESKLSVTQFVAPRTPVEKGLAVIWGEVLSLGHVGINDNFADLGGHSLAAMQIVSRVLQHFQLEVPVRLLFEFPTVAAMAAAITKYQAKNHNGLELAETLARVESVSELEAQRLLTDSTRERSTGESDE